MNIVSLLYIKRDSGWTRGCATGPAWGKGEEEDEARSKLLFTVFLVEGPEASLPRTASAPRGRKDDRTLWELTFVWPLRPPGLSVASRMRSSRSMRPALRKALATMLRLPEGGAELDENMG